MCFHYDGKSATGPIGGKVHSQTLSQALGGPVTRRERAMVEKAISKVIAGKDEEAVNLLFVSLRGDRKRRERVRAKQTRTGEMFHGNSAAGMG